MTTSIKKFRSLLCIFALLYTCSLYVKGEEWVSESDKKKEISRTFSVSKSDNLNLDTRYGDITISHWNRNEISIRVVVEAKARNERRVSEMLDYVKIDLNKTGNTVYGSTSIKNFNGGNNERLSIHYYISMPSQINVSIDHRYGNINLPEDNEGKYDVELSYGKFFGGNFTKDISIEGRYSDFTMGNIKNAALELSYSGRTSIGNANNLVIESRYSSIGLKNVDNLTMEDSYGHLSLEKVKNATLEMKYSEGAIQKLENSLIIGDMAYSNITVREVSANFTRIEADSRYGTLKLYIPKRTAFSVEADDMKYGDYEIKGFNSVDTHKDQSSGVDYRSTVNEGSRQRTIYYEGNRYGNLKINGI